MTDNAIPLLTHKKIEAMAEDVHTHQFNPNAVRHTKHLSDILGLSTMGVHLVRIEPGHDSTQYHYHHRDEEFIYVLSGRGIARLDDKEVEVGPGDFMGFTRQSCAHNLTNPFEEDLVYLMGGTRSPIDICDYPDIARRMYRVDGDKHYVDLANVEDVR
jgi:uncharacterized cupin superfamily protein